MYSRNSATTGRYICNRSVREDRPMRTPPASNRLLTPNDPRLSILPKPNGNLAVGGLSAQLTVASVIMSETRSVRLCIASAESAV
jgi:hypothetical protein